MPNEYPLDKDWLGGTDLSKEGDIGVRSPSLPSIEGPLETEPPPLPSFSYSDESRVPIARTFRFEALREVRELVPAEKLQFIPWLAICRLDVTYATGRRAPATGFLIDPVLVATSAHVLYHPDTRYGCAKEITVTPGFQQPRERRRSQTSRIFARNPKWGADSDSFLGALDYGVIAIADRQAFEGFHILQWGQPDSLNASGRFTLSGYPSGMFGQWRHTNGIVGQPGNLAIRHNVMASPGQSGSPLFTVIGQPQPNPVVFGIHSKEASDVPGTYIAKRVTHELIADYRQWKQQFEASGSLLVS